MELQDKMKEAIEESIDENTDIGGDFRMDGYTKALEQSSKECTKIAIQEQIDLLRELNSGSTIFEFWSRGMKEIKQLEEQLKQLSC